MNPRHWIKPDVRAEARAIWLAGNDFSMNDIAKALGLTEAQVRYAVRDLPKSPIQQQRSDAARKS